MLDSVHAEMNPQIDVKWALRPHRGEGSIIPPSPDRVHLPHRQVPFARLSVNYSLQV